MQTRREFLGVGAAGLSFMSLGAAAPGLFARAAEASARAGANDHALVVIELAGGNDGLNTLVPFEDPLYYKNRRTIGIPEGGVLKLGGHVGLHPRMAPIWELYKEGKVAVVQGVGYPDPDRSHFRSMEIWHTASTDARPPAAGWLGRYLDATRVAGADESLKGLALAGGLPQAFRSGKVVVPVVDQLDAFAEASEAREAGRALRKRLGPSRRSRGPVPFLREQADAVDRAAERLKKATDSYRSAVEYPDGELGGRLRRAAQVLAGGLGVRVLFVSQDGYDTHADQGEAHGDLLDELSRSLAAFLRDLDALKLADRVAVMVFSEFGRRVDENASRGTDHGAASCMFLLGPGVKGGLVGRYPSLETLGDGDLLFNTDFRSVYASLLDRWLGCPSAQVLGRAYPTLDLFRGRD